MRFAGAGAAGTVRRALVAAARSTRRCSRPCRNVLLSSWLGRESDPPAPEGSDPVGEALVRRYLAAFGPAATADLRAWCGLAGLPGAVAAIREELVTFRDERGRELLDLPGV
ncbi:DNA glycosylase AlkZ-like family protein [Nonomuraea recticatena]|uniref:Winged helix DNA-binding domain-containing protein n=1 Tax=Nonomuraea recticatena TaxID=46178 RepID=A0ABN3SN20_9ACTN